MSIPNITKIPAPRTPLLDEQSGDMTPAWYRFFYNLFDFTGSGTDSGVPVNRGGTGQTSYTDGQLLIGNTIGNTLSKNTLTPGTAIGITNGNGTIEIDNTGVTSIVAGSGISRSAATGAVTIANTGVLSVIAGTGISVSSATGNVTIANTAVGVTSFSGGTTGFTPSSPTTGAVVLAGVLNVANGGTGATDAATARTNLGLGSGLSVTITTAKLTTLGANGSMTFVNGILTAQTQAT
jgi:predicted GNAT family acetyltransferase